MRRPREVPLAATMAVVYATIGFVRHRNHWSGGFDLGIFDQAAWSLAVRGTPRLSVTTHSIFEDHVSAVILVFAPLYRIWATPLWLFAAQGLALAVTIPVMRALAQELGAPRWLASVVVAGSPSLLAAAVFDFHPSTLAVPAIAGALLGAVRDDARLTLLCGVAVVLCRAELGVLLLGLAVVRWNRSTRRALALVPPALALVVLVPALGDPIDYFQMNYSALGEGPADALLHPWRLFDALREADAETKLVIWFLPAGFLALVRWRWAIGTLLAFLPLLLSQWPGTALPWYHYAALTMPFVLGATFELLGTTANPQPWTIATLTGTALGLVLASPLSSRAPDDLRLAEVLTRDRLPSLEEALRLVGTDDAVSAFPPAIPHLDHRADAWMWPAPFQPMEPTVLGVRADPAAAARIEILIIHPVDERFARQWGFEPALRRDDLLLLRRARPAG